MQITPVLLSLFLVLCVTSTSLLRLIDGRDRLPPRGCSFLFNRPITTPEFSIFGSVPSLYFLPETDQTFRISQYFFPLSITLPFRLSGDANNESRIFRTSATGTSVPVSPNPKRFAPLVVHLSLAVVPLPSNSITLFAPGFASLAAPLAYGGGTR